MTLEYLKDVDHFHVGAQLHADKAFVEIGPLPGLQLMLRTFPTFFGDFLVNLDEGLRQPVILGVRPRAIAPSPGLRRLGRLRRAGFDARRVLGREWLWTDTCTVGVIVGRTSLAIRYWTGVLFEIFRELLVVFNHLFCECPQVFRFGTSLCDFREPYLIVVV